MYVKTHFAELKRDLPTGTPHKEVMSRLAAQYKEQKLSTAAKAAGAAAGARAAGAAAAAGHDAATPAGSATVSRTGQDVAAAYVSGGIVSAERSAALHTPDTEPVMAAAAAVPLAVDAEAAAAADASASEAADSDDDGWQTAEEEVEEQTSSLLSFMDRLALA
jgi:hypothetical protein